ncbi:hexokinase type 2-like [Littorina saxatilis]|uniref:hexokinase type 2-like n=1 Tax=Littorina saxatilis TaxID=31220 RepID=UPI0038B53E47
MILSAQTIRYQLTSSMGQAFSCWTSSQTVQKKFYRGKFHKKKRCFGLVFPFPCEYSGDLTEACLTKWASGFRCEDVTGQTLQELLEEAFRRKHPKSRLDITVILNDAAGTLLSSIRKHPKCRIAVSLADSFHACYVKESRSCETTTTEDNNVFINSVLGALGDNGCLQEILNEYDKDLDHQSINPKRQILEKMVSMTYIAEIVRLVLMQLEQKGLLFSSTENRSVLNKKECFTADFVSLIESDKSEHYLLTDYVLRQLQVEHYTIDDCTIVSYVVHTVLKRAAQLAAAGLAVLINRMNSTDVTVAVDGALNRYHPDFLGHLLDHTRQLVKSGAEVKFISSYYGSVIGAALAAKVPKSPHNPCITPNGRTRIQV